ncbi:MAG: hypothetical protein E3J72_13285 [Planctomycetota bacterium]|nr:MAG: hypothetical protein E3J72_13285 [Planctomycetota bacterium]
MPDRENVERPHLPNDGDSGEPKPRARASGRLRSPGRRSPVRREPGKPEIITPFSIAEIARGFVFPFFAIEWFLGSKERLSVSVNYRKHLLLLSLLLLLSGLLFALPYGFIGPVGGVKSFWKISTLFTGSLLICFPCFYVFWTYLGFKLNLKQGLTMALIIPCVAGMFTFGFAPIIWFIDFTTCEKSGTPVQISFFFLLVSLTLGIVHMGRCFVWDRKKMSEVTDLFALLWAFWLLLLVFINYRMAKILGLLC